MYYFDQNKDFSHTYKIIVAANVKDFVTGSKTTFERKNITIIIKDFLRIYFKMLHTKIKETNLNDSTYHRKN